MKNYNKPYIEEENIELEDVIATSNGEEVDITDISPKDTL